MMGLIYSVKGAPPDARGWIYGTWSRPNPNRVLNPCQAAYDAVDENTTSIKAGHLGQIKITKNEFLLGEQLVFDKEDIDHYDF